jgi:hypothetical protein
MFVREEGNVGKCIGGGGIDGRRCGDSRSMRNCHYLEFCELK